MKNCRYLSIAVFLLSLAFSSKADSCESIRTVYSDASCCAESNSQSCFRTLPSCKDSESSVCIDSNGTLSAEAQVDALTLHKDSAGKIHAKLSSTTTLGVVKVDGSSVDSTDGLLSAFSGDYSELSNIPAGPTLPEDLNLLTVPLEMDQSKVGFGVAPQAPLHVGGSVEQNITASRYECGSSYVLQTTGTVNAFLSEAECESYAGGSLQSSAPAGSSLHTADTQCTVGTKTGGRQYAVDNYQVDFTQLAIVGDAVQVPIAVCEQFGADNAGNGYSYGAHPDAGSEVYCAVNHQSKSIYSDVHSSDCQSYHSGQNGGCLYGTVSYQDSSRVYLYEKSSGAADITAMTEELCTAFYEQSNLGFASFASFADTKNGVAKGCSYGNYDSSQPSNLLVYWAPLGTDECSASSVCIEANEERSLQRTGFQLKNAGAPSLTLTDEECKVYANSVGISFLPQHTNVLPSGCVQGILISGYSVTVYFNSRPNAAVQCGEANNFNDGSPISCVEAVLPETSMTSWCDVSCASSPSYSIDTTNAQCICHSEGADTCTKESTDYTDLFTKSSSASLPQGCSVIDGTAYYSTEAGPDCSQDNPCVRRALCFTESIDTQQVPISLISEDKAWLKVGLIVSSDERIKSNIKEVEGDEALESLRRIATKYYDYKDEQRGPRTIGFIAQQVKESLPIAVSTGRGFLPNLMKPLHCRYWTETGDEESELRVQCEGLEAKKVYRVYVTEEEGGMEKALEVETCEDGTLRLTKKYFSIFAFGEEVKDFHKLDKQKLFALAFSGAKQLDEQAKLLRTQIAVIKQRLQSLEQRR